MELTALQDNKDALRAMQSRGRFLSRMRDRKRAWQLYVLMAIPLAYLLIFRYYPMLGAQIAFKNYRLTAGIWGSPWSGFNHFARFINSYQFLRVLKNTLVLSFYGLLAGFPLPILLALSLNYLRNDRYRKTVQMVTYAPHFISTVVIVGMILQFLAPRGGLVNNFVELLGGERVAFMADPGLFPHIYVWSNVWQHLGYSSIIYIATLAGIDPNLHEAAIVDGANIPQRIWHVDLPGIMPTAVILLILNTGRIMEIGFEKTFLMQNPLNLRTSEVINTYVYKVGLTAPIPQFSYAAAIGLFKSFIGLLLLMTVNRISRHVSQTSLW